MSLREWYAGRTVFVTGVTSELGRALLEKILRCLPSDVTVCVLLRSRNDLSKEDRLKKIFASPGYERLRMEVPDAISRVKSFEGNLLYEHLGLSAEDKASLAESVSVVFHAGGPQGTVLEYCDEFPKLRSVVIVTSIFRYRGNISEHIQHEIVPDLPIAMVRLPFVGPAYKEPMPGFVEILKGPTAFMVGAGFAYGDSTLPAEVIPIDLAVNTMIAAAWEVGMSEARKPTVYNATTLGCTWDDLIKKSRRASWSFPYPTFGIRGMTSIGMLYWILVLLLEWLPSVLCDVVLGICGRKQRIVAEYDRVRNALRSLQSVSSKLWVVERNHVHQLQGRLATDEQEVFPVTTEIDIETYVLCSAAASRRYCVQENELRFVKIIRLFLLFVPAMLVVSYIAFCSCRTNKVR